MSGKKDASRQKQIESLTKRISELEKKAGSQSIAVWLTAIGTTLQGLGSVGLSTKPARAPACSSAYTRSGS